MNTILDVIQECSFQTKTHHVLGVDYVKYLLDENMYQEMTDKLIIDNWKERSHGVDIWGEKSKGNHHRRI